MQPGAFCGLRSLESLDLSNNELTTAPELLPVKSTLRYLKLGNNKIQHFPSDYFDGFDVLEKVGIENNGLHSTPNMGYVGQSLKDLGISYNKLKTLDDRMTGGLNMTVLEELRARKNEIQHINVAILAQMPKLNLLDLSLNQLHHLADPSPFLHLYHRWIMALDLDLNPLTCDKALSWLLVLTEQEIIDYVGDQVKCHQPPCLQGRDVMGLSKCLDTQ